MLDIPKSERDEFTPTLNKMGYMCSTLDPYSKQFVQDAKNLKAPVLEIGASYGETSLEALRTGATVWSNDLDERHLKILENRCPPEFRHRLTLLAGHFPNDLNIKPQNIGSILIARVLHFFEGSLIAQSLSKAYDWLMPGGKIYVITETPYLKNYLKVIPDFERRIKEGQKWPGEIRNLKEYTDSKRLDCLPSFFHFLSPDILEGALLEAGFKMVEKSYISRPYFPEDIRYDGRESAGVIGVKY